VTSAGLPYYQKFRSRPLNVYCTNLFHHSTAMLITYSSVFARRFPTCFGYSIMREIFYGVDSAENV